jgi:hypothetical protein
MEGILIGNLLVGPGPVINRNGRHESFKVEEIEGVPEGVEEAPDPVRVDAFFLVQVSFNLQGLNRGEAVLRDVLQPDNALPVENPGVDYLFVLKGI